MRYIMVLFTLIKLKPDILHTHLQVNRFIYLYTCINRKCKLVYTAHSEPSRLFNGNKERVDDVFEFINKFKKDLFLEGYSDEIIDKLIKDVGWEEEFNEYCDKYL